MKNSIICSDRKGFVLLALMSLFAFSATANPVGAERARLVAKNFLNNNGACSKGLKDLSVEAGFANVYVFSTENSFVLVAADDCMQPILGYSLNGSFDLKNMPVNKAAWIQEYSQSIQYAVEHQTGAAKGVLQQWNDLAAGRRGAGRAIPVVEPLLQTHWDQTNPYNLLCPSNTYTGCVATAMAQVMKYWNYPSHGIGSHSYNHSNYGELSAEFQNTIYDWTHMTNTYDSTSTDEEKMAVATLMYHCGVSVNMNYSSSGSVTVNALAAEALRIYFNYSSETVYHDRSEFEETDWIAMLKADLDVERPVFYTGSNSWGGHAFVFDGYDSESYFHVNWGWGGNQDEYYSINGMSPGTGSSGTGQGTYNLNQGAILGAHPSDCAASEPTNLTFTQDGANVTLSWDPAISADSYNIYCDGNKIGDTSATSFSYLAPFGSFSYWVRSVDANGELSLSSNVVNVTVDYPMPVVNDLGATASGNTVNLTWTAPNWCYPETPSATLTYGNGSYYSNFGFNDGTSCMYWGHRYPASTLSDYNNMSVYKISFFAVVLGAYELFVYQGTTEDRPETQILHQNISVEDTGWTDVDFSTIIPIDASLDLWVFLYDPEARLFPAAICLYSGNEANYYTSDPPTESVSAFTNPRIAFLIRTFVTDGTYTYNLYRNGSQIANDLDATSYSDNDLAAGVYKYNVKTNYYAGESAASNDAIQPVGDFEGHYFVTEGAWNDTNNWLPAVVPTDADNVFVMAPVTIPDGCVAQANDIDMNHPEADITIAEGGQLVSGNAVNGTIQKHITGYGESNEGWYLMASPVDDFEPTDDNLLTDNYDLYYFDQTQDEVWRNYKDESFTLDNGKGYLYATQTDVTLNITGELTAAKDPVELVNQPGAASEGWNLIGNPYPCNVTINVPFYRMVSDSSGLTIQTTSLETTAIKPMEGVFVQYTTSAPEVTFTKAPTVSTEGISGALDLSMSQGGGVKDNAIIRFDGGQPLQKFSILEGGSKLFVPQDGKDYAVVSVDGNGVHTLSTVVKELPIYFKAAENGEYTITAYLEGIDLAYLHLIDDMTGADMDLLVSPNYTFTAKTTDNESRFRLAFIAHALDPAEGIEQPFAFFRNGNWIILNEGNATLQVIDLLGRILSSETINGSASVDVNTVPGVYVMRLVGSNYIRTQKVIVK